VAIDVIRALWRGDTVDHLGAHYEVDNARLFDPPDQNPPIVVSGFGPKAIELAGRIGDGYYGTTPVAETIEQYRAAGGDGPTYGQLSMCWAADAAEGRRTVHRVWPNAAGRVRLPSPAAHRASMFSAAKSPARSCWSARVARSAATPM